MTGLTPEDRGAAFAAITDWINGAPCTDPAAARALANRIDAIWPPKPPPNSLVRCCDKQLNEMVGAVVPEILRRDITFRVNIGGLTPDEHTMPGIVVIGGGQDRPGDLESIARHTGQVMLKILTTPETLWMPVAARREFGVWVIEAVPLLDFVRLTARTDEAICRDSHIDPTTGQYHGQEPPL